MTISDSNLGKPAFAASHAQTLGVFTCSMFVAAALMFAVQPMAGKMMLPLIGGAPAGWVVAMAFFQLTLLAGYFAAHLCSRLTPVRHGFVYLAVLALGLGVLPVDILAHASIVGSSPGPWNSFMLLCVTVAPPFFALAMSAPTLQRLFAATEHPHADDPYFLFAASNLGSFVGLFSYPLLIEVYLPLTKQAATWTSLYVFMIALAGTGLFIVHALHTRTSRTVAAPARQTTPLSWERRLLWIALAFMPSALMLAVTTHITTDIVSVPLVWTAPLGIYLLTFVAAFARRNYLPFDLLSRIMPITCLAGLGSSILVAPMEMVLPVMLLPLVIFAIIAAVLHRRLAEERPSTDHLTEYFLLMSFGGALGGIVNAFVFPFVLDDQIEYQILLVLVPLLHPDIHKRLLTMDWPALLVGFGGVVALAILAFNGKPDLLGPRIALVAGMCIFAMNPRLTFAGGAMILLFYLLAWHGGDSMYAGRSFFGVMRVKERIVTQDGHDFPIRQFSHGSTIHGFQPLEPELSDQPMAYYARTGPIGDVYRTYNPRHVAVIGLGAGTLACYDAPGRSYDFYEIDPLVVEVARKYFTYLDRCGRDGKADVITGDGRIEMQKRPESMYDLIIVDAYTSDAMPVHIATVEAMKMYADHLVPGGVLIYNISNRYFELQYILSETARQAGLKNRFAIMTPHDPEHLVFPSSWVIFAREQETLDRLALPEWNELPPSPGTRPWTDDYSNILEALR